MGPSETELGLFSYYGPTVLHDLSVGELHGLQHTGHHLQRVCNLLNDWLHLAHRATALTLVEGLVALEPAPVAFPRLPLFLALVQAEPAQRAKVAAAQAALRRDLPDAEQSAEALVLLWVRHR